MWAIEQFEAVGFGRYKVEAVFHNRVTCGQAMPFLIIPLNFLIMSLNGRSDFHDFVKIVC